MPSSKTKQQLRRQQETQRAGSARARLAAEQERRRLRKRRMIMVVVPIGVVVLAVLVLVGVRLVVGVNQKGGSADSGVVPKATSVPAGTLDRVGAGTVSGQPKPLTGAALTKDGKPKILYVGAEYCPYCAAERWSVVVALSRFGSFSGLGQTSSSASDVYPNTATLSFKDSRFTSSSVVFTSYETEDNEGKPLQTLAPEDEQVFRANSSDGSIPFIDIGGKYMISGATYDAAVLQGKSHQQIADALADPDSPIAKSVDGAANSITAAICATTKNAPANVCTSAGVKAAAEQLP